MSITVKTNHIAGNIDLRYDPEDEQRVHASIDILRHRINHVASGAGWASVWVPGKEFDMVAPHFVALAHPVATNEQLHAWYNGLADEIDKMVAQLVNKNKPTATIDKGESILAPIANLKKSSFTADPDTTIDRHKTNLPKGWVACMADDDPREVARWMLDTFGEAWCEKLRESFVDLTWK